MKRLASFLFFAFLFAGCRDKYELPLRESDTSLLVVEGLLNAGTGPTTITLSKTVKVSSATVFSPVLKASLTVEDKSGGSYPLAETTKGAYTSAQLPLVFGQEYRLRIRSNGKEYLSDYVVARKAPEIDSISWKVGPEGATIFANAHDAANSTRYYKWDFDEIWEINTYYPAIYKWTGGSTIVALPYPTTNNHVCWKYDKSKTILLGSTAQLASDVVSQAPLLVISPHNEKLGVRYSMLLRQQSLTKAAYEYLQLMKKNTESLGSIFDPLPSELKGNIKSTSNPEEAVIGYLSASSVTEKRLFITAGEANWSFPELCPPVQVANSPAEISKWVPNYLPYDAELFMGRVVSYYMAEAACVDCTKRGGDLAKPSYW